MPKDSIEDLIHGKVEQARNLAELGKATPAQEITDPSEIEKKIARARKIFFNFLYPKIANLKRISFSVTFDGMRDMLELSEISPEVVQNAMDEIVLSAPGMA